MLLSVGLISVAISQYFDLNPTSVEAFWSLIWWNCKTLDNCLPKPPKAQSKLNTFFTLLFLDCFVPVLGLFPTVLQF